MSVAFNFTTGMAFCLSIMDTTVESAEVPGIVVGCAWDGGSDGAETYVVYGHSAS